jgi:protein-L-isoaspartate(D-aspartate) O-methyltransferase
MIFKFFTIIVCITLSVLLIIKCKAKGNAPEDYDQARDWMVRTQIESRGVKDKKVLSAMRKVERHKFVLPGDLARAYDDGPLPIGEGQTISQPYIVALMTEVLDLDKTKRVLEIGTGSGYQAAVLAEICDSVYTMEIIEKLGRRADKLLKDLGYDKVKVKVGDGYKGWKEHAPFDAIIVTCAPTHVPEPLKEQLVEGGKIIIPVGAGGWYGQELILFTKEKGRIKRKDVIPVRFVPMVDEKGKKY